MTVRVRIAPSPTGNLHIGTARTAVFNWLYARHLGGKFILRIEDTDLERSRPEYTQNILDGLTWLGLTWDEGPFFQTKRFDLYKQAIQTLQEKGLAYRCYCTEEELEQMRAAQVARKEAPRYDNRHRNLTAEQQAAFEAEGRRPVIRFKIDDDREISWNDMVRGKVTWKGSDLGGDMVIARRSADNVQDASSSKKAVTTALILLSAIIFFKVTLNVVGTISDLPLVPYFFKLVGIGYTAWFVYQYLIRADNRQELSKKFTSLKEHILGRTPPKKKPGFGQPLYNMAVVVDDIDMQITHVIRGEDHIANTAKQILLYEALGAAVPEFAHTPLILNKEGQKLSKRKGVTSIFDFQKLGFTAEALGNYMTLLGWSPPDSTKEIFTLQEAAEQFGFERVNKAGAKFDWDKLNWINSQYLHKMPVSQMTDLLIPFWKDAGYEFDAANDRTWLEEIVALIGPSLVRLPVSDRSWLEQMLTQIPDISPAPDAIAMSRYFFTSKLEFSEEGKAQLQQEGAKIAIEAILKALESHQPLTEAGAQEIIKQVTKEQNLKKGVIMRSLRAALTGDVHGPDLIQSWLILNRKGLDRQRLQEALTPVQ